MYIENLLGAIQASHTRYVVLGIDPDQAEEITKMVDSMIAYPGVREWWSRNRADSRSAFSELVKERLSRLDAGYAAFDEERPVRASSS